MSETYENLYTHTIHHNVKRWLTNPDSLKSLILVGTGVPGEDANTIRNAVEQISEDTLIRRLAYHLDCDENVEAIRKAAKRMSECRLARKLARALSNS
jgi:hypothetical protein